VVATHPVAFSSPCRRGEPVSGDGEPRNAKDAGGARSLATATTIVIARRASTEAIPNTEIAAPSARNDSGLSTLPSPVSRLSTIDSRPSTIDHRLPTRHASPITPSYASAFQAGIDASGRIVRGRSLRKEGICISQSLRTTFTASIVGRHMGRRYGRSMGITSLIASRKNPATMRLR